jgi:ribonuclease-3
VSTTDAPLDADALLRHLQVRFSDPSLLEQALIHRSYAFEHGGIATNERLEFLGDSVLALVVTDEIYHAHPDSPEGKLAKVRAAAVKTGSLAAMAREIGLGRYVRLGRGEANSGGADKDSILADTFEAVLGAYYLDQGFAAAYDLVRDLFGHRLVDLAGRGASLDYKTSLQELVAAEYETMPRYAVSDTGPDHEKVFTADVTVDGRRVGQGSGRNKKEAEQAAARQAYLALTAPD